MAGQRSGLRPPPQPGEPDLTEIFGGLPVAALVVSTAALFYLGILPTRIINLAAASVSTIF